MTIENMSANQWADFWYYLKGVNVIPSHNLTKKPKIAWKKYQNEPVPEELFKEWKEKGMFEDGIAIICGKVFRSDNQRLYLNAIDCDNKAGTDAMCPQGIKEIAKKTLVEQHSNPDKCHILFYTTEPLKNRTINPNSDKQIEVKSMGKSLLYCTGGYHKDGTLIDIVGTEIIHLVKNHQELEKKLDEILGTEIKVKLSSSKVTDEELSKLNEGDNRQGAILSKLGTYFATVPQDAITQEDCINKSIGLNSKLGTPYEESRAVTIGKDFFKYRMNDKEIKLPKNKTSKKDQVVKVTYERIYKEPQILRAITLDEQGNAFILVYVPVRKIDEENGEITYHYCGHFVTNGVDGKRCFRIDDKSKLSQEDYVIGNLFPEFKQLSGKWKNADIDAYLLSNTKVNPKDLFNDMMKLERKYFEKQFDCDYYFEVVWILHTYFYTLFDYTPYIDLIGDKGIGKSKNITLFTLLSYNGISSGNASVSVIFRTVEGTGGSLFLDETEDMQGGGKKDDQAEKANLLRNGFYIDGTVSRADTSSTTFMPTTFSVYGPKGLAHINFFDEVLTDRTIPENIIASNNPEIVKAHPNNDLDDIYDCREREYRLFLDYAEEVKRLIPEAEILIEKSGVYGRDMDLWKPLVTIALFLDRHGVEKVLDKIIEKMKIITHSKKNDNLEDNLSFRILQIIDKHVNKLPEYSKELYKFINQKYEEEGFEQLRPIDIRAALIRLGFHQGERTNEGVPWKNITPERVYDIKVRRGLVKPTQSTLENTDSRHKKDDNVDNVGNVV